MAKEFYQRLKLYFEKVGQVLRGEAEVASIFPNTSDIGISRELVYSEFLKQHAPSKCNVFLGGFLFGSDGEESKQIDIIISTDTAPRYNFNNQNGNGKSFGPVEGCLGVASIKSKLDKAQLFDALASIASIPATKPLGQQLSPLLKIHDYEDWPYKIIYASDGLNSDTIMSHLKEFYVSNPLIPISRRPNIIHVAGKFFAFKVREGMRVSNNDGSNTPLTIGEFHILDTSPDVQALMWALNELQTKATATNHINFDYSGIINKMHS